MHSNEHSLSTILNQPFDADLDLDNFLNGKMRLRLLKFVLKLSLSKRLHAHHYLAPRYEGKMQTCLLLK